MAHYEVDGRGLDERGVKKREIDIGVADQLAAENGVEHGETAAAFLLRNAQASGEAIEHVAMVDAESRNDASLADGSLMPDSLAAELFSSEPMPIDSMRVEVMARRWTTRVIALLLAGQAFILLAIIWVTVSQLNWAQQFRYVMLSMTVMDTILLGGLLLPMAIFNGFTAMGLWLGQRTAWLRAMTSQGILLIFCLSSYVADRGERFIFMLMLTCIVLVLYLNTYDVRLAFNSRESKN